MNRSAVVKRACHSALCPSAVLIMFGLIMFVLLCFVSASSGPAGGVELAPCGRDGDVRAAADQGRPGQQVGREGASQPQHTLISLNVRVMIISMFIIACCVGNRCARRCPRRRRAATRARLSRWGHSPSTPSLSSAHPEFPRHTMQIRSPYAYHEKTRTSFTTWGS